MKNIIFFDFDLDVIPEKRWEHIFDAFTTKLPKLKNSIKKITANQNLLSDIGNIAYNLISESNILHFQEIQYIAQRMELSIFEVLSLQLTYEMSSACTTAVLKIKEKNFFLRTMDWPMDFLKDITIGLNIMKNNKCIAKATTWLGYIGFLTATDSVNNCTYAINYRRTTNMSLGSIIKNFFRTLKMNWPIGYLIRYIVEINLNTTDAIELLSIAQLISPCYITIYAPNDKSCILTRNFDKLDNIRYDNLIQTNCDCDKTVPNILSSLERVALIKKKYWQLNSTTNKSQLTPKKILRCFLKDPVLNSETIYIHYQYDNEFKTFVP